MWACLLKSRRCRAAACLGAVVRSINGPVVAQRYSQRADVPTVPRNSFHARLQGRPDSPLRVCHDYEYYGKQGNLHRNLSKR